MKEDIKQKKNLRENSYLILYVQNEFFSLNLVFQNDAVLMMFHAVHNLQVVATNISVSMIPIQLFFVI